MGDAQDDDDDFDMTMAWAAHVELEERLGSPDEAAALRKAGPYEPPRTGQPIIIDTDIGGDPDDAIAVAIAALRLPELTLVVTSDEREGQRARFARHLLDLSGRRDVSVISGRALSDTRYFCVDGLTPRSVPAQPTDVVTAVAEVCAHSEIPVRWVGMGPMSNLADVLTTQLDLVGKLTVTQMGGAINYRDPSRAEHNVRLDPEAARAVLDFARNGLEVSLLTSDVTFTSEIEITAKDGIYRRLASNDAPQWAQLLHVHLDRWFDKFHPGSIQHDGLALSFALQLPFIDFSLEHVALDDIGRMSIDPDGVPVFLSHDAYYDAFNQWLDEQLDFGLGEP